jgi:pimeloyl-ACP methyl ester carboxylesterase
VAASTIAAASVQRGCGHRRIGLLDRRDGASEREHVVGARARGPPGTNTSFAPLKEVDAGVLRVAYAEAGPAGGPPVVLCTAGRTTSTPSSMWLRSSRPRDTGSSSPTSRGYGATRFLSSATARNGQPSALAADGIAFMDALGIQRATARRLRLGSAHGQHHGGALAGALQGDGLGERLPDRQPAGRSHAAASGWRIRVVVPVLLRDRARPARLRAQPARVQQAHLAQRFAEMELRRFNLRAQRAAFDNPDHVDIVVHNYRWRLGLVEGEPRFDELEQRLAKKPAITVPTITLEGDANGAPHLPPAAYAKQFTGPYAHRQIDGGIGHNLPQEAPQAFAQALVDVNAL